jgi:hypothetical protein
MNKGN